MVWQLFLCCAQYLSWCFRLLLPPLTAYRQKVRQHVYGLCCVCVSSKPSVSPLLCSSGLSLTGQSCCLSVLVPCRHPAELPNHVREHIGSGGVRRPFHLPSLRHHLAVCRPHRRPALWPAVCFQRQRGESPRKQKSKCVSIRLAWGQTLLPIAMSKENPECSSVTFIKLFSIVDWFESLLTVNPN